MFYERLRRAFPLPPLQFDAAASPARSIRWQAVGIGLACAAVYFLTRSPALDEWDSVQFALGVGNFNLWWHQPHPPGYPLYVAAGWLFSHALPLAVPAALQLASALGGGLFVACWFVLGARRFGRAAAWLATASLATLLIVWMSATKALTDPLGTGLFALTLVLADACCRPESRRPAWLLAGAALAGAVAVGVRPQNAGVLLLVVVLAAVAARRVLPGRRRWALGPGVFVVGNLLWLWPTVVLQARTPESSGDWTAYPRQLLGQWRWRLDQPKAFIAATAAADGADLVPSPWLYRLEHHPLGWLTRGFGFALDSAWGWLGIAILAGGWTLYVRARARDDVAFWRAHGPWAAVYILTIFCFLPGDQRYYLPIFPLLILPAVLGWRSVPAARWLAAGVPVATLAATLPFVGPNHTEPAPPVRLARWLQTQYAPADRPQVWLVLRDARRHFEWYAPEFHLADPVERLPWPLPGARALYTDDPRAAAALWPPAAPPPRWVPAQDFRRSPLIYRKHNEARLYRLENLPPPAG